MSIHAEGPESLGMSTLSVVIIAPNEARRRGLSNTFQGSQASVAKEIARYPGSDDAGAILETDPDVIVVDLDSDPERALESVEAICGLSGGVTVMVYSSRQDSELLVRSMRAGAREFLTDPVLPATAVEALVRAAARREDARRSKRATGKLLVFAGAKGGAGVTTVASNFAVALAKENPGKVALVDLDLQLGDAALTLGVASKFSVLDALENPNRLDSDFLSVLFVQHKCGLAVLSAPDAVPELSPSRHGLEKLLRLSRESYSYVVVDAGSHSSETYKTLFEAANTVYFVTQVGVVDLRNANRFISHYFAGTSGEKVEIVLNRFIARNLELDEAAITRALTKPAKWKVPNDYATAKRANDSGAAIALEKNQMARTFAEMAAAASGQVPGPKKKKFSLFG